MSDRRERLYLTGFFRFNTSSCSPNIKTWQGEKRERPKKKISERHKSTKSQKGKDGTRRREQVRGDALFRQPDNIPSPEHICGCPLTPSRCSLWRQSEQRWPACRFPIISLAEGSGLPIHHQVWTCKLWWQSISCYTNHTTITLIISTRSFSTKKIQKTNQPWSRQSLRS